MSEFSRLYLISPGRHGEAYDLLQAAKALFEAGVTLLQVREPHLKDQPLAELVAGLLELARPHGARLFLDAGKGQGMRVARRLKVGVHFPAAWPVVGVKKELQGIPVGATIHQLDALMPAVEAGVELLTVSPLLESSPSSRLQPIGLDAFREAARRSPIPLFAMGGVTLEKIPEVLAAGAWGVATLGQVFEPGPVDVDRLQSRVAALLSALDNAAKALPAASSSRV
jgi:thiamine-phosphate pyrophosphorylase